MNDATYRYVAGYLIDILLDAQAPKERSIILGTLARLARWVYGFEDVLMEANPRADEKFIRRFEQYIIKHRAQVECTIAHSSDVKDPVQTVPPEKNHQNATDSEDSRT